MYTLNFTEIIEFKKVIKEKYGELRVYSNILFDEINEIIKDYCKRSRKICIKCGNHLPDEEIKVIDDLPLCKECIGGLKYVTHKMP